VSGYLQTLIEARTPGPAAESYGWEPALENTSEPLTDREIRALELLVKGCSNQEIAEAMVVSESTVKFHLRNIYLKLGVHTRTQATVRARELRLA
jgi:LuxR family maltose regulon positive regulatory protein